MLMQFILPNLMYALDHLYYVVLPGEYLEIDVPPDLGPYYILAIETRPDAPFSKCCKVSQLWPQPLIEDAVPN